MKTKNRILRRGLYAVFGLVLTVAAVLPGLGSKAAAYGQITSRSIMISNSATSATSVEYTIGFTETASGIVKSIVVDFCDASPLYGDACTVPGTFSASGASLTGQTGTSGWTLSGATAGHFVISGASFNSAAAMTFTVAGITNPSATGSYYARIYTYAAQSNNYSNVTTPGTVLDFGGIALSTANVISITAKVQETLTFCVSGAAPTSGCGGTSTPAVTLGHGTPAVLTSSQVDDNGTTTPTYTQLTTNAASGAIVRMKNSNTCGGLSKDGGSTCDIAPKGSVGAISAGTAAFGLYVAGGSGGTGTVTANANYNDGTSTHYAMRTANVTSTYGDPIESSSGPVSDVNSQLTFAAGAASTTPAGVYTANMTLIATGTF